jgi:hypothetical protein
MPDEPKKVIVDDDWKAEARREKERLASQEAKPAAAVPLPSFAELVNIVAMQAMAGLGLLTGPRGERMPPDPEVAKHFIDMLQLLEDKTKNNLTAEEKTLLDQVLYETRMLFVQVTSGAPAGSAGAGAPPMPGA